MALFNTATVPTTIQNQDRWENLNFMRYLMANPDQGITTKKKSLAVFSNQTLVGADHSIDTNQFGTVLALNLGSSRRTGEVVSLNFYTVASLSLSGTIIRESFHVHLFRANPGLAVGATLVGQSTIAYRVNTLTVDATDWHARTGSEGFGNKDFSAGFESSDGGTLWTSIRSTGTTQWNSVGTANEKLVADFILRYDQ